MFKREIENELKKWKQSLSSSRQAVVVKGLRQIGKTTSVLGFCRENFPSVVHIDFRRRPDLKPIFAGGIGSLILVVTILPVLYSKIYK